MYNANHLAIISQSASHGDEECTPFKAWLLSHKGKATSDVVYNSTDPPAAYINPFVHSRLNQYTEVGRQLHGPKWDPVANDLDPDVVMIAAHG